MMKVGTQMQQVTFRGKQYDFVNSAFVDGYKDSYYGRGPRLDKGEEYLAGYEYNETVDMNFKHNT